MRIITKRLKFSEKHSEASWRYYINTNAIPKDGEIDAKGMHKVMQLLVEDGTLVQPLPKTDKYVDMSYIAEARRTLAPERPQQSRGAPRPGWTLATGATRRFP